jgi:hypothetical protein
MLGVRYKSNTENNSELEINNFYNYGLLNSNLNKIQNFSSSSFNKNSNYSKNRPILSHFESKLLLNNPFKIGLEIVTDPTFLKLTVIHYCLVLKSILGSFFLFLANNFKSSLIFYF